MGLQNYPAMTPTPPPGTVIARNFAVTPLLTRTVTGNGQRFPASWTFITTPPGLDKLGPFTPSVADKGLPALTGVECYELSADPGTTGVVRLDLTGVPGTLNGTPVAVSAIYSGDVIHLGARLVGSTALNPATLSGDFLACAASGPVDAHGHHAYGVVSYDDDTGSDSKAVVLRTGGTQSDGSAAGTVNGVTNLAELVWQRPTTSTGPWKLLGFRVELASAQYTTTWVKLPPGIPMTEYFDGSRHSPAVDAGHTFAWSGAADASASTVIVAVPKPADPPPGPPTALNVTGVTSTGGVLHWTAPADKDLDHYRVYRDMNTAQTADVPAGTTEYTFTGLGSHQMTTFTVTAIDKAGHESQRSDPLPVTTLAAPVAQPGTGSATGGTTGTTGGTGGTGGTSGTQPPTTGGTQPPTTGPTQPPTTTATPVDSWLGGEQAKRSQTFPAPLTGADVAEFMNMRGDAAVTATATTQLATVTLLARAYTRGHGFGYVDSKHTNRLPNDEIRAVILTATARLVANPEQIAYSVGGVGFREGFHGWSLAELQVLNRYRPRFA